MMTKSKTRGLNVPVPQNRDEAADFVFRIGELNREVARRQADMNDALARIKDEVERLAEPLREEGKALTEGLKCWCEANRATLTDNGKVKYADLGSGLIRWRTRPPKVSLPRDVAALIDTLKRLGLRAFIRSVEEPNKEAMLDNPALARTVPGVKIGSEGEDFVVEPFETQLSDAKTTGRMRETTP